MAEFGRQHAAGSGGRMPEPEIIRDLKLRIDIKNLADAAVDRGYERLSHLLYRAVGVMDEMIRGKETEEPS